jgi:thiol-disulfide isomerase/thioredoxin
MNSKAIKNYALLAGLIGLFMLGRYYYFKPKYVVGADAPVFTAQLLDGRKFDLEDLKGKFILLEFWGSWCGPCRRANPGIVQAYQTINDGYTADNRPFEIVSIGIETDSAAWIKAIKKDGLNWPYHTSSVKRFRDPIATMYGVREIPAGYLINPDGRIMSVNPGHEELVDIVTSRLD